MAAGRRRRTPQLVLLLIHPPISLLYLFAMHSGGLEPRLVPMMLLGLFPVMALLLDVVYRIKGTPQRPRDLLVTTLTLVEIVWAILCVAMVNFAIVWRLQ